MFLNPNKTVSGFTLPTTTSATTTGFSFGGGDAKTTKPSLTLGAPISSAAAAPTGFNLGGAATTATPQFSFGNLSTTTASTAAPSALSFSLASTTTPSLFSLSSNAPNTTTVATTTSAGFSLTNTTLAVKLPISSTTTTISGSLTGLAAVSNATSLSTTTTTAPTTTVLPSSSLTFAQLEDNINKWTVDLEEQGKLFSNQAKQINAWDRLLKANGEKILSLSDGIDRVIQLQQDLDQELDFVLAQQKELEDLVVPLEKELFDIPVTDMERNQTYQMAETLDTQLKQMSEDLKEIIEHLNESNKNQELSNPITQIGRILNAHMNSLQWIDTNTTKITTHLDQISKMHDMNKRNHELNLQRTYD